MRISVIFTGGTIGSSIKRGWADVDSATHYALLKSYENNQEIEFVTSSPFSMLSENLSADELNILQKEIEKKLGKGFDGIIVTHGTDTLQYSAAAVEYAFNGCDIPVVLVSADYPLEDERTNGYINFETAVEFIKSKTASGVFVSYKNNDEANVNIHIASRILQHREYDSNVYSIGGKPFAVYDGRIICSGEKYGNTGNIGVVDYTKNAGILSIESYPGNDYSYSLESVKAVILKPYHSGTLDTANEQLKAFCKRASKRGIPVFVTNLSTEVSYKSTALYDDFGIVPMPCETYVSAYMKIWAGISLEKDVAEFAKKEIANEFAY